MEYNGTSTIHHAYDEGRCSCCGLNCQDSLVTVLSQSDICRLCMWPASRMTQRRLAVAQTLSGAQMKRTPIATFASRRCAVPQIANYTLNEGIKCQRTDNQI